MLRAAALVCGLLGLAASANATVLFSQPFDGGGEAYAAQNDKGGFGNFATTYDNFTLSSSTTVTEIDWTGGFFNPGSPSTIAAFTVSLYSDAAGQPGSRIYQTIVGGAANEAFLGKFSGVPFYTYGATLNVPLTGGTQYWLSVVPDLTFPPQWGWGTATGGNAVSYQDFLGARSEIDTDFAFTISGASAFSEASAIPEIPTWAMLALGFAGLGFAGYRRAQIGGRASFEE